MNRNTDGSDRAEGEIFHDTPVISGQMNNS